MSEEPQKVSYLWLHFPEGSWLQFWRLYNSFEKNNKFKLHLKESLLIKRDKPELIIETFIVTLSSFLIDCFHNLYFTKIHIYWYKLRHFVNCWYQFSVIWKCFRGGKQAKGYCVCVKRIMLCNCLWPSSPFCFSASLIWNIWEFRAANYFTDHWTADTIQLFVPIKKTFFGSIIFQDKLQQRGIP